MSIDTIKNVLLRILSINKNLNEDSLHNLLVASGWDDSDIKEGINIFKAYKISGGDSDSVSDYKILKAGEISNAVKVETGEDINKLKKVIDYKVIEVKPSENFIKEMDTEKSNVISLLDTHVPAPSTSSIQNTIQAPTIPAQEVFVPETQATQLNVPLVQTPLNYMVHQSHLDSGELDVYNKREGKSIFLVILDVVLFLVTLGLLIYILLS